MKIWLFRYAIALIALGALSAATVGGEPTADVLERAIRAEPEPEPATTVSTTTVPTTTATPSLFPPLPETVAAVPAIETSTSLVLPVTGGEPGAWQVVTPCAATAVIDGAPVPGAHIVLDPGHGGSEPGAVGPSGLTEAALNLDVARRAADLLAERGATVVLTRTGDTRVTLQTRAAIAVALRPLAFISVHHNAAPIGRSDRPGSELYHQLDDPRSKRLAGLLWEEYQEELGPYGTDWAVGDRAGARARRSASTGTDYYGVLRRSRGIPAVLSEAAFITNPAEDALLNTPEFRQAEAEAIADAVVRLVATDDPGSGYVPTKVAETPAGSGGGTAGCVDPPLG